MPVLGLGVWRMDRKDIKNLLPTAIKIGYRHFDCAGMNLCTLHASHYCVLYHVQYIYVLHDAADYKNELEVGEALKEAFDLELVKREDLFITTKAWISCTNY